MLNKIVDWNLNGRLVRSPEGISLLNACNQAGAEVLSLCGGGEDRKSPACLLCLVGIEGAPAPVASCGQIVREGIIVDTESRSVTAAVKASACLLLNEHGGDCYSPCSLSCGGRLDTALMSRLIRGGHRDRAAQYAFRKLVFPELLSKLCSAPCIKNCRRGLIDAAVDIPLLHGEDIMQHFSLTDTGRNNCRALVYGNSPETWAAAHFLNWSGSEVTLVHDSEESFLNGLVRVYGVEVEAVTEEFRRDRERLKQSGIRFIDRSCFSPAQVQGKEFRWILPDKEKIDDMGGSLMQCIIKGRKKAFKLLGINDRGSAHYRKSVSRINAFTDEEKDSFLKKFPTPSNKKSTVVQAESCFLCTCSAVENCGLKDAALKTGARQDKGFFLRQLEPVQLWGALVHEYAKCVGCMKCINKGWAEKCRTAQDKPRLGTAFKGIKTRIINPEGRKFSKVDAIELVQICPTGALRMKYEFENE